MDRDTWHSVAQQTKFQPIIFHSKLLHSCTPGQLLGSCTATGFRSFSYYSGMQQVHSDCMRPGGPTESAEGPAGTAPMEHCRPPVPHTTGRAQNEPQYERVADRTERSHDEHSSAGKPSRIDRKALGAWLQGNTADRRSRTRPVGHIVVILSSHCRHIVGTLSAHCQHIVGTL